jgi:hypothetical protein
VGGPGTSAPLSLVAGKDGDQSATFLVGTTVSGTLHSRWLDVARFAANPSDPGVTTWSQHVNADQTSGSHTLYQGDPSQPGSIYREYLYYNAWSKYNAAPGYPVYVNSDAGTGTGLVVGDGTNVNNTTTIAGGTILPAPVHDAAAPNGSIYLGLDHLDTNGNPQFCVKWGAGVKVMQAQ